MSWSLRIRLSAMMLLQYAIWGAWAPVLWPYLTGAPAKGGLGFSDPQAGWIFGLLWLGCILAPFIGGQIVDRWFPTQWFLAAAHLAGGLILLYMSQQKDYSVFWPLMGVYSLLYAPTLALTNSLAFHHLDNPDKQFGAIRVFGTIGWILAGVGLMVWRNLVKSGGHALVPADSLILGGICSVAMGIFCCFLPPTPPKREGQNPWAFLEALSLLKNRQFLIFMLISFVVTTELQFYYMPTSEFLESGVGITHENVSGVMTTAQIAEIVAMAIFLPLLLPILGVRKTLAIGVIAWPLRYLVFAVYKAVPYQVVVASLTLHGIGYTFFFVVTQIYVNRVAPPDILGSAQALLTLVTLGLGNWLGTMFTSWVMKLLSTWKQVEKVVDGQTVMVPELVSRNWTAIFLVPCALTIACAIAFLLFFHDPRAEAAPAAPAQEPQAKA